jgi:hypothetical protein
MRQKYVRFSRLGADNHSARIFLMIPQICADIAVNIFCVFHHHPVFPGKIPVFARAGTSIECPVFVANKKNSAPIEVTGII